MRKLPQKWKNPVWIKSARAKVQRWTNTRLAKDYLSYATEPYEYFANIWQTDNPNAFFKREQLERILYSDNTHTLEPLLSPANIIKSFKSDIHVQALLQSIRNEDGTLNEERVEEIRLALEKHQKTLQTDMEDWFPGKHTYNWFGLKEAVFKNNPELGNKTITTRLPDHRISNLQIVGNTSAGIYPVREFTIKITEKPAPYVKSKYYQPNTLVGQNDGQSDNSAKLQSLDEKVRQQKHERQNQRSQ